MVVQISFSGFVSFRYIPRSRITWSYRSFSFIYFLRNLYFSIVAAPVYIPTSKCTGVSFFSTSWPILVMYYLFFFIVAIITLWGDTSWFMFAFPWMLSIFSHSCLPSHLYVIFAKMSIQILCPFLIGLFLFCCYCWVAWFPYIF